MAFDQLHASTARWMMRSVSGGATPSKTSGRYGSSLITSIGSRTIAFNSRSTSAP